MRALRTERHWTVTLVAFANVAAGFALFAVGSTTLAGVVSAAAYVLVVPELVDTPDRGGVANAAPAAFEYFHSGVTTAARHLHAGRDLVADVAVVDTDTGAGSASAATRPGSTPTSRTSPPGN